MLVQGLFPTRGLQGCGSMTTKPTLTLVQQLGQLTIPTTFLTTSSSQQPLVQGQDKILMYKQVPNAAPSNLLERGQLLHKQIRRNLRAVTIGKAQ